MKRYKFMEDNKAHSPLRGKSIAGVVFCPLLIILCIGLLTGCSGDEDHFVTAQKVLLVYLAGDNDLSGESRQKLEAIARGFDGSAGRRIVVYRDDSGESPSLLEITGKKMQKTVETYEEENSADAQVFGRVIAKAKRMYPQAKFNLLVFSHASGWLPNGSYSTPSLRSILADGDNEMELSDFASAIPDKAFEYIVFEACYMAGIEVAYELRNKAEYIAASSAEIPSPGFTDIYASSANDLVNGNIRRFMQNAFDYFNSQADYLRSATFSIIRTGGLETLANHVKADCDFNKEITLSEMQFFERNDSRLFADFGDYYSRLSGTEAGKQKLNGLIDACVIWKASTPFFMEGHNGFSIDKHSGLTTYIMQERYTKLNECYRQLSWYNAIDEK